MTTRSCYEIPGARLCRPRPAAAPCAVLCFGIFNALRLIFDTAALLCIAALTIASLLLLSPAIAHAQGGVPLWTNRFNGPANGDDYAVAIAVDRSGNLFVTGSSRSGSNPDLATIKYSNVGVPLWTNRLNDASGRFGGIAVDSSGNVFVTCESLTDPTDVNLDYATVKYSNAGVPLWTNRYDGPSHDEDRPQALALDINGNVFVTGISWGGGDYATVAYSGAGVPLWTNRYDGEANSGDYPGASAVDRSGNVLVTGISSNGTSDDYATIKYSNTGVPLWTNRYNGPANGNDFATAIALDKDGNAFVSGRVEIVNNLGDYATIKYSNSGVPLWTNRYNGPANRNDVATAIAVDSAGNVFVTGYSEVSSGECCDYATVAYSSEGTQLWVRRYNGPGNSQDITYAIAVDSAGNVFVTGESTGIGTGADYATVAYSNSGVPLWTKRYDGPSHGQDQAGALALDSSGNVFVTGSSWNGTNSDYVTIKYSSSVPPPRLDFQLLNNQLVLSWTDAGFYLQTAPAVTGSFTNLSGATSPYTNLISGSPQFFRLNGD